MFSFHKKNKSAKYLREHIALVKHICQLLPEKYNHLFSQLKDGNITGVHIDNKSDPTYKRFSLDVYTLNKYE